MKLKRRLSPHILAILFGAVFAIGCSTTQVSQTGRPILILAVPDLTSSPTTFNSYLDAFKRCTNEASVSRGYTFEKFVPFDDQYRLRYQKNVSDSFRTDLELVSLLAPIPVEQFRLKVPHGGMYKLIQVDVQPRRNELRATSSLYLVDVDSSGRIVNGWDFSAGRTALRDGTSFLEMIERCFGSHSS